MELKREFSWSYNRYTLFENCKRAYYFYYYGSWGGWRDDCDSKSSELYKFKKINSVNSLVEGIFVKVLSSFIYENFTNLRTSQYLINDSYEEFFNEKVAKDANDKKKYNYLKELYRKSKRDIYKYFFELKHQPLDSSNIPLLKEQYFDGIPLDVLNNQAYDYLLEIVARFGDNEVCDILFNIPHLAMKNFKPPLSFYRNGIKIWTNPTFIWSESGDMKSLDLFFNDPIENDKWPFKATINKMFLENLFSGHNNVITLSSFITEKTYPKLMVSRNMKEVVGIIDKSSHDMLELTNLDSDIREELFPKIDDFRCSDCNFREYCKIG